MKKETGISYSSFEPFQFLRGKTFILTLPFCLLLSLNIYAQTWNWARQPILVGDPAPQSDGEGSAVATDKYGNVYQTGFFAYDFLYYGKDSLKSKNPDFFLSKYDASGNVLWARQGILKSYYDASIGSSVATDLYGNVYVTGSFQDSLIIGPIILVGKAGSAREVFLIKYDSNGNVIWARQSNMNSFSGYGNESLGVTTDKSGNIYITGDFHNVTTFGPYQLNCPVGSAGNVFIVKYDSSGNVGWAKQTNIPSSASRANANSISCDVSGNLYITGGFHDTLAIGPHQLIGHSVVGDIFTAKYDLNGNVVWAKQSNNHSTQFWSNGPIMGNSITSDKYGSVYIAGNFEDTISFDSKVLINPISFAYSFPYGDMLIVKYDSSGNVIWAKAGQPTVNATFAGWGIAADTLNHIFFSGGGFNFSSAAKFNYSIKFGSQTFSISGPPSIECSLLLQLDTAGNVLCGAAVPLGGDDYSSIAVDPSGRYVYMGGDYYAQFSVTVGPDILVPNNPLNQGVEIPFIVSWSPCNPTFPISASVSKNNITCKGLCNGKATANVSGGTAPFTFVWNTAPVQSGQTISSLCPGTYTVTVTDKAGATATSGVTISDPSELSLVTSPDTSLCLGLSATLSVTASGSTPGYSYAWLPVDGLNVTTGPTVNASPASSTTYTITATSSGGCSISATITVTITQGPEASVSISDNSPGTICKGTDITFIAAPVNGGNPSYQWKVNGINKGISSDTFQSDTLANNDLIICTMTSNLSCLSGSRSVSDSVRMSIEPLPVSGTITTTMDTICKGTITQLFLNGSLADSLQWQWSSSNSNFINIIGATEKNYITDPLTQNTYFRIIAKNNTCSDTSSLFIIITVPTPVAKYTYIDTNNVILFNSDSSIGSENFIWDFGDSSALSAEANPIHIFDSAGTYHVCLTVKNNTKCTFTLCKNLSITPTGINKMQADPSWLVFPNPFSTQVFIHNDQPNSPIKNVSVYDILGRKALFTKINSAEGNNIILNLSELMSGIYYLQIETEKGSHRNKLIKL